MNNFSAFRSNPGVTHPVGYAALKAQTTLRAYGQLLEKAYHTIALSVAVHHLQ